MWVICPLARRLPSLDMAMQVTRSVWPVVGGRVGWGRWGVGCGVCGCVGEVAGWAWRARLQGLGAGTLEEGLVLVVVHVTDDHSSAQGVDDVRVVRVQEERVLLHAWLEVQGQA
jgi:hypothetical protein